MRRVYTEEENSKIIGSYLNNTKISDIEIEHKTNSTYIFKLLKIKGIPVFNKTHKLTDQNKHNILKDWLLYPGQTSKIAKKYSVGNWAIINILKKNNLNNYGIINKGLQCSNSLDCHFFEKIDDKKKAYFLGLLYSDGYVTRKGAFISLQDSDRNILELFKNSIKSTNDLKFLKRVKAHRKDNYRLELNSTKLAQDLIKLGCVSRKSLILNFPGETILPQNLFWHFIRGYFDGDGSVYKLKQNNLHGRVYVNITGSQSFITTLNQILISLGYITCMKNHTKSNVMSIEICRQKMVRKFYLDVYSECDNFYLKRKKDIFDNWFVNYKFKLNNL